MVRARVALVSMPFVDVNRPSIGLSLIKAHLTKRGIETDLHYLNLKFQELIDPKFYLWLVVGRPAQHLLGEWIFSHALSGRPMVEGLQYLDDVIMRHSYLAEELHTQFLDQLHLAREMAIPFLEQCLTEIDWSQYQIVGFTSVFQQNVAALSLAQRLKERYPHLFIMFGGANAEGEMGVGLIEGFPFVDAICSGEGDLVVPEFIEHYLQNGVPKALPGILMQPRHRTAVGLDPDVEELMVVAGPPMAPVVQDMDALPYPDYTDFFAQYERANFEKTRALHILVETSRGCWWGAKSHCTFCGLNGSTLAFRSKSGPRALEEIVTLLDRYGHYTQMISAVDNILDMQYFKTMIPELRRRDLKLSLFYEVKANMQKEQVEAMAEAGFDNIQPGVESLSNAILREMRKGVTGLQNIQLLKWCCQFNVYPAWNFLFGFPGEDPAEYTRMAEMIPSLSHLVPPQGWGKIRLDRFSPNFNQAEELGFTNLRPIDAYRYIYPQLSEKTLFKIAYYFAYDYREPRDVMAYVEPLIKAIQEWHQVKDTAALFSIEQGDKAVIWDFRPVARQVMTVLSGPAKLLYTLCDRVSTPQSLARQLSSDLGEPFTPEQVRELLRPLVENKLILEDEGAYLSLAVPLGYRYSPPAPVVERLLAYLKEQRAASGQAGETVTITARPVVTR